MRKSTKLVIAQCLKKAAEELEIAANLLESEWVSERKGERK